MKNTPLRVFLKLIFTLAVFSVSLFAAYRLMNRSQAEVTSEMPAATLPVVTMRQADIASFNTLHGYTREMDVRRMRSTVYVAGAERTCFADVVTMGARVDSVSFEVRTLDGENLVERTQVTDAVSSESGIAVSFSLKDLIEYDEEYMLVLLLDLPGNRTVRYYTRLICTDDEELKQISEHVRFATMLHDGMLNASPDIKSYLETTPEGRAASFSDVDIHSSFALVTFEDLEITEHTVPRIDVYDLHTDTASVSLGYDIVLAEEERTRRYHVTEDYFTRCTKNGSYLIDFKRSMRYVFTGEKEDVSGSVIDLSYTSPDIRLAESASGSAFAFVNEGRLFVYHLTDNRLTQVFGFYTGEADVRSTWQGTDIRMLRLDEGGNLLFDVTGYFNSGAHEGEVGTAVYDFSAVDNTITELLWLQETCSEEILLETNAALRYINYMGVYYCLRGDDLYAIRLYDGAVQVIARDIVTAGYRLSFAGNIVAWQDTPLSDTIHVLDMGSEELTDVSAAPGEPIRLLGFLDGDLVYGRLRTEHIRSDSIGNPVYPMYQVLIQNMDGAVLASYENESLPVTDITVEDNRIVLHRVQLQGADGYTAASDDQIMRTTPAQEKFNRAEAASSRTGFTVRIVMKQEVDSETRKFFITQVAEYETLVPDAVPEIRGERYYTYDHRHVAGVFTSPARAVSLAYDICGQVTDEQGRYVYYRGNMTTRNQIMSLTQAVEARSYTDTSSLSACIRAILEFEGIGRNVDALLTGGMSAAEILRDALPDARVLALDGCPMASVLYYVDLMCDYPVLVQTGAGAYQLLLGFNETELVLFDPTREEESVYKTDRKEAEALFAEYGNRFVTYVK